MEDWLIDLRQGLYLLPEAVSDYASRVDALYLGLVIVSGVLTVALVVLVVGLGWRYRASSPIDRTDPRTERIDRIIEVTWASTLLAVFLGLFVWASMLYFEPYRGSTDAMTVNVIGKQWMWKAQHPDGTREINTLHVPVGETVRLRMTSQDVIHSFYLPSLRLKRDVLPERYTDAWFTADQTGEHWLFCAEYCGTDHSRMRGKIVVMEPSAYDDWLTRTGGGPSPVAQGRELFQSYGCSGCHVGDARVRAPSLAGIYGRTVPLAKGGTITADEGYLRDSIVQPQKHVVAGYEPVMPSYAGQISEDEILQIVAYIQSLEPGDWEAGGPVGNNVNETPR
ncbi:MAG: cytochrome c oxidase subunit II [Halofilum sp. (in: g-proteobacteria)]